MVEKQKKRKKKQQMAFERTHAEAVRLHTSHTSHSSTAAKIAIALIALTSHKVPTESPSNQLRLH